MSSVTFEIRWQASDVEDAEEYFITGNLPPALAGAVMQAVSMVPVNAIEGIKDSPRESNRAIDTKHVDVFSMRQNLPDTALAEYLMDLLNEGNDFVWHRTNEPSKAIMYTATTA